MAFFKFALAALAFLAVVMCSAASSIANAENADGGYQKFPSRVARQTPDLSSYGNPSDFASGMQKYCKEYLGGGMPTMPSMPNMPNMPSVPTMPSFSGYTGGN